MRDPKRIDRILNKLRIVWTEPRGADQLRFGQMILNIYLKEINSDIDFLFNMEDDKLEVALDKLIKEQNKK